VADLRDRTRAAVAELLMSIGGSVEPLASPEKEEKGKSVEAEPS
jgi:hypothetical protein